MRVVIVRVRYGNGYGVDVYSSVDRSRADEAMSPQKARRE